MIIKNNENKVDRVVLSYYEGTLNSMFYENERCEPVVWEVNPFDNDNLNSRYEKYDGVMDTDKIYKDLSRIISRKYFVDGEYVDGIEVIFDNDGQFADVMIEVSAIESILSALPIKKVTAINDGYESGDERGWVKVTYENGVKKETPTI